MRIILYIISRTNLITYSVYVSKMYAPGFLLLSISSGIYTISFPIYIYIFLLCIHFMLKRKKNVNFK